MSVISVGEELSDSSNYSGEGENSPKFWDEEEEEFNNKPSRYQNDVNTIKINRETFEIAEDHVNNEFDDYSCEKGIRTFYKPDKHQFIPQNIPNKSFNSKRGMNHDNLDSNQLESQRKPNADKNNVFSRESDLSNRRDNENEELKFMLSHSNTFLTSDMPENGRKEKQNVIDIDEDSNEVYEDFEEHISIIDK